MKELDRNKLSKLIVKLRKSRDLSRDEMGRILGISARTVKRWEETESTPSMEDIIHICNEFNISLEEVFEGQVNIEKEVNRQLSKVDLGIESINNRINSLAEQVESMRSESDQKKNLRVEKDLVWFLLLIIHITATAVEYLCYWLAISGHIEALITSVLYATSISYLVFTNKNNYKNMRMIFIYAVILMINLLLNCLLFADVTPGVINNIELMTINGAMYGFRYFDMYNMKLLLSICTTIYTIWIVYSGYHLVLCSKIKERK